MRRRHAVRRGGEILAQRQRQLVIYEAMRRIPLPGIAVFRRYIGGGVDVREILQSPRIGFTDRHSRCPAVRQLPFASSVLVSASTPNRPSLHILRVDQPAPRASASKASSVYL